MVYHSWFIIVKTGMILDILRVPHSFSVGFSIVSLGFTIFFQSFPWSEEVFPEFPLVSHPHPPLTCPAGGFRHQRPRPQRALAERFAKGALGHAGLGQSPGGGLTEIFMGKPSSPFFTRLRWGYPKPKENHRKTTKIENDTHIYIYIFVYIYRYTYVWWW